MRQTVVLLHKHPTRQDHYDWLIDQPELKAQHRLRTFQLTARPDQPGAFDAQQAPDHRALYLSYEGQLSNNRGHVTRIAAGQALCWEQTHTRISAHIRWANQTIHYTAHRNPDSSNWTFTATPAPTP